MLLQQIFFFIVLLAIVEVVIIAIVSRARNRGGRGDEENQWKVPLERYKYLRKHQLVTNAEKEFFLRVQEMYGSKYDIFPQVHLSTFLDASLNGQSREWAWRHIHQKSVDFLVCQKNTMKPLLAIEIDDLSHSQNDRWKRDVTVEQICASAGFPILRVENHGYFSRTDIQRLGLDKL